MSANFDYFEIYSDSDGDGEEDDGDSWADHHKVPIIIHRPNMVPFTTPDTSKLRHIKHQTHQT